jgi:hypothetical protein
VCVCVCACVCEGECECVHVHCSRTIKANQVISPVVTPSVSDRELLSERNEFEGDGLTVAVQV